MLLWPVRIVGWRFTRVQLERIETADSYQSYVNMPSVSPSACAVVWSAPGIQILQPTVRLTSSLKTHSEHQRKASKEISPLQSPDHGESRSMLQKVQESKSEDGFHSLPTPGTWIKVSFRVCTVQNDVKLYCSA